MHSKQATSSILHLHMNFQLCQNKVHNLKISYSTTKKQPNQKLGRKPKQTFLQKRHLDGQ